ncbi:MAG TPA: signal peptidase II [bacterium]|nr:signal peptidase II [bacterium]
MHGRRSKYVTRITIGSALVLAILDQITKVLASTRLDPMDPVKLIPGLIHLTLVHNRGAAFGIFRNLPDPWRIALFSVISVIALTVLYHMYINRPAGSRLIPAAIALIAAGATGNFIDRFRYGHVIDFIDTYPFGYHFPTFNLADSCITIGVTLMMIQLLFLEKNDDHASRSL